MSRTLEQIVVPQQLGTTISTLYTVPNNRTTVITRMSFTNTSANDVFIDLHLVPSGSSASDSNKIIDSVVVAAGETFSPIDVEGQIILQNSTIEGLAEAATSITVIGSGTEVTN